MAVRRGSPTRDLPGALDTKATHEAKIGPIELSVKDKETVNIPVWAGIGAIVLGGVLLFGRGKG